MQIDISTFNLLLGFLIALQVWTVKTLYSVKGKLYSVESQLDTHEQIHHNLPTKTKTKMKIPVAFLLLLLLLLVAFTPGCGSTGQFVRPVVDVPHVVTTPEGGSVTNYVPTVAPEWKATLDAIATTGQLVPPPVGSWVSLGAGGIAALLAVYARNRQSKAEDIAKTIVQGIEAMATTVAPTAKDSVYRVSQIKGNSAEVNQFVKSVTK